MRSNGPVAHLKLFGYGSRHIFVFVSYSNLALNLALIKLAKQTPHKVCLWGKYIPNMKSLDLLVSDKKILKVLPM